jgi:hypothetical protein
MSAISAMMTMQISKRFGGAIATVSDFCALLLKNLDGLKILKYLDQNEQAGSSVSLCS